MLYGTAEFGGLPGHGVVFKMNIDGSGFQVIHSFVGLDGAAPNSLIQAPDGTLYGTTRFGGRDFTPLTPSGLGVLFQPNTDGSNFQVRHLFTGTEGANPNHVLFGQDGTIYGTTISGGINNTGVFFEYDPYNPFIFVLFNFDPLTSTGQNYSGNYPTSLSQTSNGFLLITMASGGEYGSGTILLSDFTGFFNLFYAFSPLDANGITAMKQGQQAFCKAAMAICMERHSMAGLTARVLFSSSSPVRRLFSITSRVPTGLSLHTSFKG